MTEVEALELESYKHHHDTEQDRIRVGDKVVRRFGPPGAPRKVVRIWRKGPRGRIRFTFDLDADRDYQVSMYANRYQRKGDQ